MIITNGTLQIVRKTGGGMAHGRPVHVVETPGAPVSCNIKTLQDNKRGKIIDNVFTQASFEVLIDSLDCPIFTDETVVLTDNRGSVIGKFQVQDVQHLDCVDAVKITV